MYIVITYGTVSSGAIVGLVRCDDSIVVTSKTEEVARWFEKKMAFPEGSLVARVVGLTEYTPDQQKSNELGG